MSEVSDLVKPSPLCDSEMASPAPAAFFASAPSSVFAVSALMLSVTIIGFRV